MSRDSERFPQTALKATAEAAGDVPFATVYVPRSSGNIVVCSYAIIEVGYRERDNPFSIPWDSSSDTLGQTAWEALLQFGRPPEPKWRMETDWPSYRASGCKSLPAFLDEFVEVRVGATDFRHAGGLRVEARASDELLPPTLRSPRGGAGLLVGRDIASACDFESLGDLIRLVLRCEIHVPNDFQFSSSVPSRRW
jgi:hypothetical protein